MANLRVGGNVALEMLQVLLHHVGVASGEG